MRDDIVEFLGHPQPFGCGGQIGGLYRRGSSFDRSVDLTLLANPGPSTHPTERKPRREERRTGDRGDVDDRRPKQRQGDVQGTEHRDASPSQTQPQMGGNAVQADHQCEKRNAVAMLAEFQREHQRKPERE